MTDEPLTFSEAFGDALAMDEPTLIATAIMACPWSELLPQRDKLLCSRSIFGIPPSAVEHRALRDIAELFLFIEEHEAMRV